MHEIVNAQGDSGVVSATVLRTSPGMPSSRDLSTSGSLADASWSSGSDEGDYIVSEVKNHQNLASGVTSDNGTCPEMPAQSSILFIPGQEEWRLGLADFVEIIRKNGVQEELVSDRKSVV